MRIGHGFDAVFYTHLRAHETPEHLVCRLLLEKNNTTCFLCFHLLYLLNALIHTSLNEVHFSSYICFTTLKLILF